MKPSGRTLILGFAVGLSAEAIWPFVRSLRRTGYRGDVGLFFGRDDARARDAVRPEITFDLPFDEPEFNVVDRCVFRLIRYFKFRGHLRAAYRLFFHVLVGKAGRFDGNSRWIAFQQNLIGTVNTRHIHYRRFLAEHGGGYESVLLADIRDVIFQSDPFVPPPVDLEIALESATVGDSKYNHDWLSEVYGSTVARTLSTCVVACAGTVRGTKDAILSFSDEMVNELSRHPCWGIHDQAILNYLLRSGRLKDAKPILNGSGPIYTVGALAELCVDSRGLILTPDGDLPAIVHQYDRHPAGAMAVRAMYNSTTA